MVEEQKKAPVRRAKPKGPTLAKLEKQLAELQKRLEALEARSLPSDQVTQIQQRLAEVEARLAPATPTPAPIPDAPTFRPEEQWEQIPSPPATQFVEVPSPQPSPPAATFTPVPPPVASQSAADLERKLGANWLAKAGMAVLVLGVVFFLKYAFDAGWVPLWARPLVGVVGGALIFAVGELLHRRARYGIYPQVLTGGGAIIVYFSIFASHAFESLRTATGMRLEIVAALMGAVALGLGLYAMARKTRTLAGVAVAMATLASLYTESSGVLSTIYAAVLTLAFVAVAVRAAWRDILFLAFGSGLFSFLLQMLLEVPAAAPLGAAFATSLVIIGVGYRRSDPAVPLATAGAMALYFVATVVQDQAQLAMLLGAAHAILLLVVGALRRQPLVSLGAAAGFGVYLFAGGRPEAALAALLYTALLAFSLMCVAWWNKDQLLLASGAGAGVVLLVAIASGAAPLPALAIAVALSLGLGVFAAAHHWTVHSGVALVLGYLVLYESARSGVQESAYFDLAAAALLLLVHAPLLARVRSDDPMGRQILPFLTGGTFLATWVPALLSVERLGAEWARGPLTLGLAVLAFLYAAPAFARSEARLGAVIGGAILAIAWPPIQFDGTLASIAWSAQLFLLAMLLLRRDSVVLRILGTVVGALVGVHAAGELVPAFAQGELTNLQAAGPFGAATVALVAAWFAMGRRAQEPVWSWVHLGLGFLFPLVYFALALEGFAISIAWAAQAVVAVVAGFALDRRELRLAALGLFALVLTRIFFVDLTSFNVALRIITFLVVGALLLLASFLYARRRGPVRQVSVPNAPAGPENPTAPAGPKP